jgi:hypothetical protein
VFIMFGVAFRPEGTPVAPMLTSIWFVVAVASLVVSYTVEYLRDFLAGGGYKRVSPMQLMSAPMGRLLIMHITIIFAGWFVDSIGAPLGGLLLLVLLKTGFDVAGWLRARRAAGEAGGA